MRLRSAIVVVPSALALGLLAPAGAASGAGPSPAGTYTTVEVPGASYTAVTGVNNRGTIVGYYGDDSTEHGFIESGGELTTVDVPGTDHTRLTSINDAGTVTGSYLTDYGNVTHGFLRDAKGNVTVLDDPEIEGGAPSGTVASGVNDAGTVVGYYFSTIGDPTDPTTAYHGFVWRSGSFTTYDAPGSTTTGPRYAGTQLFGVNKAGTVVGRTSFLEEGVPPDQAILVSRSQFSTYVDPVVPRNFCGYTHFVAINVRGTIAGNSGNGCAPYFYAWLKDGDTFTPVAFPDATATVVNGINDRGVVVGSWRMDTPTPDGYRFGPEHGFVLITR